MIWILYGACAGPEEPVPPPVIRFDLGSPAPPELIRAWDIDVDPTGASLPPGRGTAAEGAAVFAARCAACHGAEGSGGSAPRLVTTEPLSGFEADWRLARGIGNWWPYPTTVFDYVRRAMPQDAPGSLTSDETYAVVAYLLTLNGAVAPDFAADASSLPAVKMPSRVRWAVDDRETSTGFR